MKSVSLKMGVKWYAVCGERRIWRLSRPAEMMMWWSAGVEWVMLGVGESRWNGERCLERDARIIKVWLWKFGGRERVLGGCLVEDEPSLGSDVMKERTLRA